MMHQKIAIYMVSTPLHLYCATAIAASEKNNYLNILVFIDQKEKNNIYLQAVSEWKTSPFKAVLFFQGIYRNPIEKWKSRKQIFANIKNVIDQYTPDEIYTGNDRRIEFQYAMHCASQKKTVCGIYMDEGIFSYLGRSASTSFSDNYIDQTIKKWVYGSWWTNPPTVGGSRWINEIYAAFPQHIHELLRKKTVKQLPSQYFDTAPIKDLSANIIVLSGLNRDILASIDVLITLPHESLAKDNNAYKDNMRKVIDALLASGKQIAFKPHPRDTTHWYTLFQRGNIIKLPKKANFESILPLLTDTTLLADMSSTLLICTWLKPDMKILALDTDDNKSTHAPFIDLYHKIGIKMVKASNLIDFL